MSANGALAVISLSGQIEQVFAPRAVPLPGSEAALRGLIAGYTSGKPDYAGMTPELAERTRAQLPGLKARFAALGALRSVTFQGPDPIGGDTYTLHFVNGGLRLALLLDPTGKILAVSSPMPLPGGG